MQSRNNLNHHTSPESVIGSGSSIGPSPLAHLQKYVIHHLGL